MEQNKDQSSAAVRGEAVADSRSHQAWKRMILYTDTIGGKQTCRDDLWAITTTELKALQSARAADAPSEPSVKVLSGALNQARDTLRYYAEQEHFIRHQPDEWDAVSGEPQSLYEDTSNTATVEDGTLAKNTLNDIAGVERYTDVAADALDSQPHDLLAEKVMLARHDPIALDSQPTSITLSFDLAKLEALARAAGGAKFQKEGFEQAHGNGTFYGGLIMHENGETIVAQCVLNPWADFIEEANPANLLELTSLARRQAAMEAVIYDWKRWAFSISLDERNGDLCKMIKDLEASSQPTDDRCTECGLHCKSGACIYSQPTEWIPTAAAINALPEGVRKYIHNLVANSDPAGTVAHNTLLTDNCENLQVAYRKMADALEEVRACFSAAEAEGLSTALAETSDEGLKDLVERRLMHALYVAEPFSSQPTDGGVRNG